MTPCACGATGARPTIGSIWRLKAVPKPAQSEKQFQAAVIQYARLRGWRHIYHTHDSRHSPAGFPDLILLRRMEGGDVEMVVAELKTDKGKATEAQMDWLVHFDRIPCEAIAVGLWRPSDWDHIEDVLK